LEASQGRWQAFTCPKSGKELRSDLKRKGEEALDEAKEFYRRQEKSRRPFLRMPESGQKD